MLKNIVLVVAMICSCIYMTLFWISNTKANQLANKIQKPFMAVSLILLVLYLIL
jgi:succinate dehydrogenase hydrophobic anchor subunit